MSKLILKDWRRRLQKAVKRGRFSNKDKARSSGWLSCAIGERDHLCRKEMDYASNINIDNFVKHTFGLDIYDLGMKFSDVVYQDSFLQVQDIIEQIERLKVKEFYK